MKKTTHLKFIQVGNCVTVDRMFDNVWFKPLRAILVF